VSQNIYKVSRSDHDLITICSFWYSTGYCPRKSATFPMAQKRSTYVVNWTFKFRRRFTRHLDVHWTSSLRPNSTAREPIWTY